jgi:hypothetical protein
LPDEQPLPRGTDPTSAALALVFAENEDLVAQRQNLQGELVLATE